MSIRASLLDQEDWDFSKCIPLLKRVPFVHQRTKMLGMFISNAPNPLGAGPWKLWVDHVTKQKEKFGLKKATLVYPNNGGTAAASSGFVLTPREIQKIKSNFREPNNNAVTEDGSFSIKDKTYIVKSASVNQIIAFNGGRYVIVSKSKTMLLVALCESKSKYVDAAEWLTKLCHKLIEKDF